MKTITATDFKENCLSLFKEMEASYETYVITEQGEPVAEVKPLKRKRNKVVLGAMRGQMQILGDIVGPICPDDWFDERDPMRSEPLTPPELKS